MQYQCVMYLFRNIYMLRTQHPTVVQRISPPLTYELGELYLETCKSLGRLGRDSTARLNHATAATEECHPDDTNRSQREGLDPQRESDHRLEFQRRPGPGVSDPCVFEYRQMPSEFDAQRLQLPLKALCEGKEMGKREALLSGFYLSVIIRVSRRKHRLCNMLTAKEKEEINQKITRGIFILRAKEGASCSSDAWKRFSVVHDAATNFSAGFVQCNTCKAFLKYSSSTSNLLGHKCKVPKNIRENRVPADVRAQVTRKCARMCGMDLRPFNFVDGQGFHELASELVGIGAQYGRVNIDDILPHPTTVSRYVSEMADDIRAKMIPKVRAAMERKECAATTDMWCDRYKKLHYLTLTAQYLTEEWDLVRNILFTCVFPDIKKTGENIIEELRGRAAEMEIFEEHLSNTTFLSDQGSNMIKALETYSRLSCFAHVLNTVLKHTFEDNFLLPTLPFVYECLKAARGIAAYLKKTGLVQRFEKTIKLDVDTRWNSVHALLLSIHCQYDKIEEVLTEKNELRRLAGYDNDLVGKLVIFLSEFKECTDDLEADRRPTIHLVLPWTTRLKKHCTPTENDCKAMQLLKKRALQFLEQKAVLDDAHLIAAFLWPKYRFLLGVSEDTKERIHILVRRICDIDMAGVNESSAQDAAPPTKKPCPFQEWIQEDETIDEVALYLAVGKDGLEDTLLQWWRKRMSLFPRLSQVARRYLCIPATSATSERNFSRAGIIISEKRTNLDPDCVNDLLVLNNNICSENV